MKTTRDTFGAGFHNEVASPELPLPRIEKSKSTAINTSGTRGQAHTSPALRLRAPRLLECVSNAQTKRNKRQRVFECKNTLSNFSEGCPRVKDTMGMSAANAIY